MGEQLCSNTSDGKVWYNSCQETKDALYEKVLKWFLDQETFSGECIQQSDSSQIDGVTLLGEIADDIFQFDANYYD